MSRPGKTLYFPPYLIEQGCLTVALGIPEEVGGDVPEFEADPLGRQHALHHPQVLLHQPRQQCTRFCKNNIKHIA